MSVVPLHEKHLKVKVSEHGVNIVFLAEHFLFMEGDGKIPSFVCSVYTC